MTLLERIRAERERRAHMNDAGTFLATVHYTPCRTCSPDHTPAWVERAREHRLPLWVDYHKRPAHIR